MSNRFDYNAGNDEQSPEQKDQENPLLEEDVEDEQDQDGEEDEDELPEDPEEAEQELRQEILTRQYNNLEKKINRKIETASMIPPFLKKDDKKIMQDAIHNKQLKSRAVRTEVKRKQSVSQWLLKVFQSIAPILPWLLIGALIIIAALAFAAAFDAMFAWLTGGSSGGSGGGMNSQFGANGNSFHAVRLVYQDDEEAAKYILNDYSNLIYGALDEVKNGNDYTVTINVTLPEDRTKDFDAATADEKIKTLVSTLAEKAYVYDNPTYADQGIDLATLTLEAKAQGIKYFGINADLLGQFKQEIVSNFILFNFNAEGGVVTFAPVGDAEVDAATVKANIEAALDVYFAAQNTTRSEKYFVYDQVLQGDKMLENVAQKKYVAMMYLPKANVKFSSLLINAYGVDTNNFSIEFNGNTFSDYSVWPINDDITMYQYTISGVGSQPAVSYNSAIAITTPTALYKLAGTPAESNYITTTADGLVTYVDFGIVLKFNTNQPFAFADEVTLN